MEGDFFGVREPAGVPRRAPRSSQLRAGHLAGSRRGCGSRGGVGDKVRLGAFVSWGNVYLTSSKATNKYKKLLGKVLTGG